ncbi:MAG: hypothetical protein C4523_03080 [Myxococcales bacterium]|nr:MAG: hypothetical protein C4523_03080 [Myxococcales bacterium]
MGFVSGIVLVPLYLRHIPADLYGAWSASGNVLVWLTLVDPGLSAVLQQRVATAYGQQDRMAVSGWIVSGVWITFVIALVVLLSGIATSFFIGDWMHLPPTIDQTALVHAFRWAVLGSALMVFSYSIYSINQGLQSSLAIGLIFVVASLLRLVLVILLLGFGFGLLAIAVPTAIMSLIMLCGNLVYLHMRLRKDGVALSWMPTRIRELAGLISFTGMARIGSVLVNNLDLFLVVRMLGPDNVNVLRFTRTGPELCRTIIERPVTAMQATLPHLLGSGSMDRAREIILRLLRLCIWVLVLCAGGFLVFNDDFLRLWVGGRFFAGNQVNMLLILSFFGATAMSLLAGLCFSAGDIRGTSSVGLAQGFLYLPLVLAGGHWFGMVGIVAASILSLLVTQGLYMPRAIGRIFSVTRGHFAQLISATLLAVVAATITCIIFWHLLPAPSWFAFVVSVGGFAVCYLAILILLSTDARNETRNGWSLIRQQLPI